MRVLPNISTYILTKTIQKFALLPEYGNLQNGRYLMVSFFLTQQKCLDKIPNLLKSYALDVTVFF